MITSSVQTLSANRMIYLPVFVKKLIQIETDLRGGCRGGTEFDLMVDLGWMTSAMG